VIVFGAIAPHGGVDLAGSGMLQAAMRELARRCEAAEPETVIVATPHNVHVEGQFAVVVAAELVGELEGKELRVQTDVELAEAIVSSIPATRVFYGSNDPALSEMPLDWGAFVPLWYLPRLPVVVVSPARDRPLAEHVRVGEAIALATGDKRTALIASADHAHTHAEGGPYFVDAEAARAYDDRVVGLIRENRLGELIDLGDPARAAMADSLWQMLILHGALGDDFRVDLLAYEAPTYFGMVVAALSPNLSD
jgi:aromatic ring-opening dioxygenase LigB subunit